MLTAGAALARTQFGLSLAAAPTNRGGPSGLAFSPEPVEGSGRTVVLAVRLRRLPHHELRSRKILDRDADRLEQGDLLGRLTPRLAARHHFADLGKDATPGDHVAGLARCRFPRLHEQLRPAHHLIVELAPVGPRRADRIDVRARRRHSPASTGVRDAVATTTMSAPRTASSVDAVASTPCRRANSPA